MTCIVGVEDGDDVVLAGDSSIGWSSGLRDTMTGKVWQRDGVGFGDAGTVRAGQVLFYELVIPAQPSGMGDAEWVTRRLATAIGAELDDADEEGSSVLVAVNGALYEIGTDLCVSRSPRGYNTVGSGCDVALGALHATRGMDPEQRARLAVEAAIEHNATCAGPVEIIRIKPRHKRRGRR